MPVAEVLDALVRPDVVAEDSGRQRQAFFNSYESLLLVLYDTSDMITTAEMTAWVSFPFAYVCIASSNVVDQNS